MRTFQAGEGRASRLLYSADSCFLVMDLRGKPQKHPPWMGMHYPPTREFTCWAWIKSALHRRFASRALCRGKHLLHRLPNPVLLVTE